MFDTGDHPDFPPVPPETQVWRYMDFPRFVALLEDHALFFARSTTMADPWEGAFGDANHELRPDVYGDLYDKVVPAFREAFKQLRDRVFLSCWHASAVESAAMW